MISYCLILFTVVINHSVILSLDNKSEICSAEDLADTNIEDQTHVNAEPSGWSYSVKKIKIYKVQTRNECIKYCCGNTPCDAISISGIKCSLFACNPKSACEPKKMSGFGPQVVYIVLRSSSNSSVTFPRHDRKMTDEDSQLCEISIPDNCPENSICKRLLDEKRTGVCVCIAGFEKRENGCIEESNHKHSITKFHNASVNVPIMKINKTEKILTELTNSSLSAKKNDRTTTLKSTTSNSLSNTVQSVTHKQNIIAHCGPDLHIRITNPHLSSHMEIISIHGYATDNKGVVRNKGIIYQWKRDISSLSVGEIVNKSNEKETLMLMNLIQGQYVFLLTVKDKSGDYSSDSVSIFVTEKADDQYGNLVDILFETDVYKFTEKESIAFSRRMGHIIVKNLDYQNCQVNVASVTADEKNRTLISFYSESMDSITKEIHIISAGILEEKLKTKLTTHKFIFDYSVIRFQSRVCYNTCGGHGQCEAYTHRCQCTLPWFNSPWHERSTGFSNCDMHVMIVLVICVAALFMAALLLLSLKTMIKIFRRRRRYGKDILRYKLLDNAES